MGEATVPSSVRPDVAPQLSVSIRARRTASGRTLRLLLLVPVALAACRLGSDRLRSEPDTLTVAHRFIEEEPPTFLDRLTVDESKTVFAWSFDTSPKLEAWNPSDPGLAAELTREAERAKRWGGALSFEREVELDPASVDLILVRARAAFKVSLLWAGRGQSYSAGRGLTMRAREVDVSGVSSFLFRPMDHPAWRQPIERLKLVFLHRAVPTELLEVQGLELSFRSPRAVKVDLDHQVRSAWAASPGQMIEREIDIPEDAELRFVYGARWTEEPIRFLVSGLPAGQGRRVLFDEVVSSAVQGDSAQGRALGRWHEAVVDLAELGGMKVRLHFESPAARTSEAASGMVFWGHPEIVRPTVEAAPPNIVLISVDTLRADRLSLYGNPRPTSPHLDAWARRAGVVFRDAVAAAPWTLPSHASMLSGLDAHRHGFNDTDSAVGDDLLLAAEIYRRNGYATLGVVGGGPLHPGFRFTQGFDAYSYWSDDSDFDSPPADLELETHVDRVLDWLDTQRRQPFFLFFHTFEVHSPHRPREPYFGRFSRHDPTLEISLSQLEPDSRPPFLGPATGSRFVVSDGEAERGSKPLPPELTSVPMDMYDSRIAFMDQQLSRLLSRLEEPDLKRRTIVVLTSDHGELLGEHGLAGHAYLHEKNLLVPLVIASHVGLGAGRIVEEQVRGVDLLPTILELAGLPVPADLDGVSLVGAMRGVGGELPAEAWSYSGRNQGISLRWRSRLKYLFQDSAWKAAHGHEALYDLSADAGEEHDISATSSETERLRRRVRQRTERDAPGLWIRAENAGPATFSGTLRSAMIGRNHVRSVDLPCRCVSRTGPDEATFRLPPGERLTLRLTAGRPAEIDLTLALGGGGAPFSTRVDPEAINEPETVAWTGSAWAPSSSSVVGTGITFWWRDKRRAVDDSPMEDEEVRRQLRALGYVD